GPIAHIFFGHFLGPLPRPRAARGGPRTEMSCPRGGGGYKGVGPGTADEREPPMSQEADFHDLIRRVRAGDPAAGAELVRRYEPAIRLAVHVRLAHLGLRRLLDSTDICQSVLASFFLRAASGQYELETPGQLVKLLTAMARNKLLKQARDQQAARRDRRRLRGAPPDAGERVDPAPSPSAAPAHHDLLPALRPRLP